MDSKQQIAEWYTGELNRIEKGVIQGQDKLKEDQVQRNLMADNLIAEMETAFKDAASNRQRKKETYAQSMAASTPSEDQ